MIKTPTPPAAVCTLLAVCALAPASFGQGVTPDLREAIVGEFLGGTPAGETNAVILADGDQIRALFEGTEVGRFTFDTTDPFFRVLIQGDEPATTDVQEGPAVGDPIALSFFDESRNTSFALEPLNAAGEVVSLTFQGEQVPAIDFLPIDLTPTRTFDARIAASTPGGDAGDGSDGGGDGGDPTPTPANPDVNGDGRVDTDDAAEVLRVVAQGATAADVAAADVNGDGVVSTADAILVLRSR